MKQSYGRLNVLEDTCGGVVYLYFKFCVDIRRDGERHALASPGETSTWHAKAGIRCGQVSQAYD